jgi:hypothetical protein
MFAEITPYLLEYKIVKYLTTILYMLINFKDFNNSIIKRCLSLVLEILLNQYLVETRPSISSPKGWNNIVRQIIQF